jgi:hypothetical protein
MEQNEKADRITALIRERVGYEQRGLADRVDAVDAELRAIGADGAAPAKRAAKRPSTRKTSETR